MSSKLASLITKEYMTVMEVYEYVMEMGRQLEKENKIEAAQWFWVIASKLEKTKEINP